MFLTDLVVMALQSLPGGSGCDIGDLLRIGGHVFDPSAGGREGVNDEGMDTTALLKSVPTGLWIGGEEREGKSTFNVLDPSDNQVLTAVANATPEDAIAALDAACAVQAEWAATPPRERGEILRAVFEKITERADDIATLMTLEMGKVVAESIGRSSTARSFPLVRRGSRAHLGPVHSRAPREPVASWSPSRPSGRAMRSRRGISRWPWALARSAPLSPRAAR